MTAPVRVVSGFGALVRGVQEHFLSLGEGTLVTCGYRDRLQQSKQGAGGANRVIFLPGDPNGAGGKIAPSPRDVGRRELKDENEVVGAYIRPLASWERQFSISIWGVDTTAPRDELAQAEATEALFEQTLQAVEQFVGAGGLNVAWGAITWTLPKENTFGTELLVSLALAHPLMDVPEEVGFPGFELQRTGT